MSDSAPGPVPAPYLGVWKRTLLRTPVLEDVSTEVYWLQTARWHADIRVPARCGQATFPSAAPNVPGAFGTSLAMLGHDDLLLLATQQGFCGVTSVEGDLCRWHRRHDFQPPSGFADVGRIVFDTPERLLEYGVEQDYFEIWERLPDSAGVVFALERPGATGPGYLLRAGRYAMRVRPRRFALAPHTSLAALAGTLDDDALRNVLDFEISFCARDAGGGWTITHSTLPWLRQTALAEPEVLEAAAEGVHATSARHWLALE